MDKAYKVYFFLFSWHPNSERTDLKKIIIINTLILKTSNKEKKNSNQHKTQKKKKKTKGERVRVGAFFFVFQNKIDSTHLKHHHQTQKTHIESYI